MNVYTHIETKLMNRKHAINILNFYRELNEYE